MLVMRMFELDVPQPSCVVCNFGKLHLSATTRRDWESASLRLTASKYARRAGGARKDSLYFHVIRECQCETGSRATGSPTTQSEGAQIFLG